MFLIKASAKNSVPKTQWSVAITYEVFGTSILSILFYFNIDNIDIKF